MNAKHYFNGFGVSIHTTERLDANEKQYRFFLDELENMDGVEMVKEGRYSVDVLFGFLFDPEEMRKKVLNLFEKVYQTDAKKEISGSDVVERTLLKFSELDMSGGIVEA